MFAEDCYRLTWFTGDLGDAPTALDVGSHVGSFSLAFASLHARAQVDAYEASPTTATYLQRSIAASGRCESVRCRAEAISTTEGLIEITDDDTCSPLNTVTERYGGLRTPVPSISLETAFKRLGGCPTWSRSTPRAWSTT